jgi:hypothetical protein
MTDKQLNIKQLNNLQFEKSLCAPSLDLLKSFIIDEVTYSLKHSSFSNNYNFLLQIKDFLTSTNNCFRCYACNTLKPDRCVSLNGQIDFSSHVALCKNCYNLQNN